MVYEFRCTDCRETFTTSSRNHVGDPCPRCPGVLKRRFSFTTKLSMPDHYNNSTGSYVRNEAHFRDELKRQSEEATSFTGIEHDFQPIDYADREACGVTSEGLDATYDQAKAEGRPALNPSTLS